MNNNIENKCAILRAAIEQFVQNGYLQTGIRDIAVGAGVSTGLVNHHFESKKHLAMQVLMFFWTRTDNWGARLVDPTKDPVLYDAVATRGMNCQMMAARYRRFYMESLHENIFFDAVTRSTTNPVIEYRKRMFSGPDPDFVLLYGSVLPYEVEKTLILKKEEGLFQNVSYDEIPSYIFYTAFEKIHSREELEEVDRKARVIVAANIDKLHEDISDEEIRDFIIRKCS